MSLADIRWREEEGDPDLMGKNVAITIHTSLKYTHECLKAKLVKAIFPFQDKTEQFIPSSEMGNSMEGTLSLSYVSIFK